MSDHNDLRIRRLRNFVPRHRINLAIRNKRWQIDYLLMGRYRRASQAAREISHSDTGRMYVAVAISPYPLLGHQVSSWIAGYMWAQSVGASYLGGTIPADSNGLFDFRGAVASAPRDAGRKRLAVPVPDEQDGRSLTVLRDQFARELRKTRASVTLVLRRDPQWWDQTPTAPILRAAVLEGARGDELRELEAGSPYIAMHVRRGEDIGPTSIGGGESGETTRRWVGPNYYVEVLRRLRSDPALRELPCWIVAVDDLPEFHDLLASPDVFPRFGGERDGDFVFLAGARVLVTSPSSFSFVAALASSGVAVVRTPWWHRVREDGRWIAANHEGNFAPGDLSRALGAIVDGES